MYETGWTFETITIRVSSGFTTCEVIDAFSVVMSFFTDFLSGSRGVNYKLFKAMQQVSVMFIYFTNVTCKGNVVL